jgi:hypothetical protein
MVSSQTKMLSFSRMISPDEDENVMIQPDGVINVIVLPHRVTPNEKDTVINSAVLFVF